MERKELVIVVAIVALSLVAGFGIFAAFFHPLTGELRARFKGGWGRLARMLKARGKRIALGLALGAAALALLLTGLRLLPRLGAPVSRPAAEAAELSPAPEARPGLAADHRSADWVRLDRIPAAAVERAKEKLHILYVHGTHGSQLASALKALPSFKGAAYAGLDLRTIAFEDDSSYPSIEVWAERLRSHLDENRQVNLVMWSWASELSAASAEQVDGYLSALSRLEQEYPLVRFVYMTGHVDGTGLEGNLHQRNEQIRAFCRENRKVLFDFADIESYDPDGNGYGDKRVNDGAWYDSDGDLLPDRNWAREWADRHPGQWFDCDTAHTHPLSANLKAYAAWWLWARLAGWDGGRPEAQPGAQADSPAG